MISEAIGNKYCLEVMVQKEKCDCQRWMLAALAVGVGLGVIAGMAIYASAYPVFQSDKWAAWVQAVGSVGAILSGIYVFKKQAVLQRQGVAHQINRERRTYFEAALEKVDVIEELSEELCNQMKHLRIALEHKDSNNEAVSESNSIYLILRHIQSLHINERFLIRLLGKVAGLEVLADGFRVMLEKHSSTCQLDSDRLVGLFNNLNNFVLPSIKDMAAVTRQQIFECARSEGVEIYHKSTIGDA